MLVKLYQEHLKEERRDTEKILNGNIADSSKNSINRKEIATYITHNYYLIASYTIEFQII